MEASWLNQRFRASLPGDSRSGRVDDCTQRSDGAQDNEQRSTTVHALCDITGRALNPGSAQVPPGGSSKSEDGKLVTVKVGQTDGMMGSIRKP